MAGIVAELELETDAALGAIDAIGSALDEGVSNFSSGIDDAVSALSSSAATINIEADASAAEATVDGLVSDVESLNPTANVDADTADAEAAVQSFDADTAALAATIPIDADVGDAETAVDGLVGTIESSAPEITIAVDDAEVVSAQDSVDGLSQSLEAAGSSGEQAATGIGAANQQSGALATGAAAAGGNVQGMAKGLLDTAGISGAAATGIGAAAAAIGLLFTSALDAQAAMERFDATFGNLAASVEQVNVGNLNRDLSELALTLGSDDDAVRQAAASFGQLGEAAGGAPKEVARLTESLIALSARAVALNPALGDVGTVMDKMGMALSRGGKFAAKYGLDISSAEIQQRAFNQTGKTSAAELTFYEKVVAGTSIAIQKYGKNLDEVINKGSENSAVTLKRLKQTFQELLETIGGPIVAPILELATALLPLLKILGSIVQFLMIMGPVLMPLRIFAALLQPLAGILNTISDALLAVTGAITEFMTGLASSAVDFIIGAFVSLIGELEQLGQGFSDLGGLIADVFNEVVGVVEEVGGAILDAIMVPVEALAAVFESIGSVMLDAFGGPLLDAIGAIGDALGTVADIAGDVIGAIGDAFSGDMIGSITDKFINELVKTTSKGMDEIAKSIDSPKEALKLLALVTKESETAGARFAESLIRTGVITRGQYTAALNEAAGIHGKHAEAAKKDKEAIEAFNTALSSIVLPDFKIATLSQEVSTFASEFQKAFGDSTKLFPAFVESLTASTAKTREVFDAVKNFAKLGLTGVATVLASAGPELGGAYLTSIQAGDFGGATLQELNDAVIAAEVQKAAMAAVMSTYGPALVKAFKEGGFAGLDAEVQAITTGIQTGIETGKPAATGSMTSLGHGMVDSFGFEIDKAPAKAGEAMARAAAEGTRHTGAFQEAGRALAAGFAAGLGAVGPAETAARSLVDHAAAATRDTGLFADAGRGAAQGYATGMFSSNNEAVQAGTMLVTTAAGATRNTGLLAAGGAAGAQGYATGMFSANNEASQAGTVLVMTAAQAATAGVGLLTAAGLAVGSAFAAALRSTLGAVQGAGLALVQAAAAATRNTGLFAESGKAAAAAYGNGLGATQPAIGAARNLVTVAAGATRDTGLFAAAGSAAGSAYASALSATAGAAESAGRAVAQAGARGLASGGSPTIHLWTDAAKAHAEAYAEGLAASTGMVAKSARALAGAGAGSLVGEFGSAGGGIVGSSTSTINIGPIEVHGVSDPKAARAAGDAIAGGVVDGLTRRRIVLAGRG